MSKDNPSSRAHAFRRLDVDGNINVLASRPRTRAHARENRRPLGTACSWSEACAATDEAIDLLGGKPKDRGIWVWYCSHLGTDWFLDLAHEIASLVRVGELNKPVRAFQRRLMDAFPKGSAQ